MRPKFYENTDNNHCLQCCIRMIINTILTDQISETDIDKESEYDKDLWTWTISGAKVLSQKIDNVKIVNNKLDYGKFVNNSEPYLKEVWNEARYIEQRSHASENFKKEIRLTKDFLNSGGLVVRKNLSIEIITNLLKGNFLITQINHSLLYDLPNSSSHYVLIYDDLSTNFEVHDPGQPPKGNYMIDKGKFLSAFSGELISVPKPSWWLPQINLGRNDLCPCDSGKKNKKCHKL